MNLNPADALQTPELGSFSLAAYLLLFAATAVLAYRRPSYAAAVLIATAPFALYRSAFGTTLTLGKVALPAAVLGLALRAAAGRIEWAGRQAVGPLALALVALLATTALSIGQAAHPDAAMRETLKALQYLGIAAAAFAAWRTDPDERPIRFTLLAVIASVSLVALAQEFGGAPSVLQVGADLIPRIAGPLEGPNQLAGFLELALPLAAAFAVFRKPVPGEMLAIGLGLAAELLTFSRSGWAATFLALAIVVWGAPAGSRRRLALPAALAVFGALAAFEGASLVRAHATGAVLEHMLSLSESAKPGGVGTRSELWSAAWTLWLAHPWLGIGADNFEYAVGSLVPGVRTHANNAYLQALVEGGIPLFLATAAALLLPVALCAGSARRRPLVLGALAGCAAFAFHQGLDDLLFFPKIGALYWAIVGLAAGEVAGLETPAPRTEEGKAGKKVDSALGMGTIRLVVRFLTGPNPPAAPEFSMLPFLQRLSNGSRTPAQPLAEARGVR